MERARRRKTPFSGWRVAFRENLRLPMKLIRCFENRHRPKQFETSQNPDNASCAERYRVPHTITCTGCRAAIEIADAQQDPWVNCPHCQARNVNPVALQQTLGHVTWLGLLGMLLVM